jgi:hypothetical protein
MSTSSSTPAMRGGPYVIAALVCEKLLVEGDGVESFIRVVDRVTVGAIGPEPPTEMPSQQIPYTLCLTIKSGEARGRHSLKVRPEKPSGEQLPAIEVGLNLEGADRGTNVNIGLQGFVFDQEGLWWFDVLLGDNETLLTRVPLRLIYQPQRVVLTGQAESE